MSESPLPHIMVVAGEASGDQHAAHLIHEIKKYRPDIQFSGLGGENLAKEGVEIFHYLTDVAVVGFVEVLRHFSFFRQVFHEFLEKAQEQRPRAVILVDYPGFNLRLAKALKKMGIKVIYYISPQVWAWKESRIRQIKKTVDKMLVFFPFEEKLYQTYNQEVECVGHPLIDAISISLPKEEFLKTVGLRPDRITIGLLPGSRLNEIQRLLPLMLETARILSQKHPPLQFLLIKAPTIPSESIASITKDYNLPLKVVERTDYNSLNACDTCLVTSGTATLETAILEKPMVVVYKTSFLTWLLAKLLIKIPYIGLVNVVAGRQIVPECIQFKASPPLIAKQLENIFTNELLIASMRKDLKEVKEKLGAGGASQRAAKSIIDFIENSNS